MSGVVSSDIRPQINSAVWAKSNPEGASRALEKSIVEPKKSRRASKANRAEGHRVGDKIGIGHERDADEHRFPSAHSLAVNETNETDTAEEQTGKEIGSGQNGHLPTQSLIHANCRSAREGWQSSCWARRVLARLRLSADQLLLLLLIAVALSRLPFLGTGYGINVDAWRVARVARQLSETGLYEVSRFPGYPVQEIVCSWLWRGGPWALNGASAVCSVFAVWAFVGLCAPTRLSRRATRGSGPGHDSSIFHQQRNREGLRLGTRFRARKSILRPPPAASDRRLAARSGRRVPANFRCYGRPAWLDSVWRNGETAAWSRSTRIWPNESGSEPDCLRASLAPLWKSVFHLLRKPYPAGLGKLLPFVPAAKPGETSGSLGWARRWPVAPFVGGEGLPWRSSLPNGTECAFPASPGTNHHHLWCGLSASAGSGWLPYPDHPGHSASCGRFRASVLFSALLSLPRHRALAGAGAERPARRSNPGRSPRTHHQPLQRGKLPQLRRKPARRKRDRGRWVGTANRRPDARPASLKESLRLSPRKRRSDGLDAERLPNLLSSAIRFFNLRVNGTDLARYGQDLFALYQAKAKVSHTR